jgi:hypothetical protein
MDLEPRPLLSRVIFWSAQADDCVQGIFPTRCASLPVRQAGFGCGPLMPGYL